MKKKKIGAWRRRRRAMTLALKGRKRVDLFQRAVRSSEAIAHVKKKNENKNNICVLFVCTLLRKDLSISTSIPRVCRQGKVDKKYIVE